MISKAEYLMGRDKDAPLDEFQEKNLIKLLEALNQFRAIYGKPMIVSSGYRPAAINAKIGGAKASNHMICLACDFRDLDGELAKYCLDNLNVLVDCGLYMENPEKTKGWVHLQIKRPGSGNRVFNP
jgi:hypothetical protein